MMLQVVLEVDGQVVLQGKDGVLCLLPCLGSLGRLHFTTHPQEQATYYYSDLQRPLLLNADCAQKLAKQKDKL